MEFRIGVTQTPKECEDDMGDQDDGEKMVEDIWATIRDVRCMLWFTDRRGRRVGVPTEKLAYVEIGATGGDRRVGFSAV